VRGRIVLTTVAVAVIAMVLLVVPLAASVSTLYNNETVQGLLSDAARAAAVVPAAPLEPGDPVEFPTTSDSASIAVYAPSGTRIAGSGPAGADEVTLGALRGSVTTASSNGLIAVAIPVGAQEQLVGAVRAALPQSAVDARVHGTWLVMAGLGAAAVVIAALLALWQARRLSRPLDALASAATKLGDGDLSVQVPRSNIREIDTVASAMNATSQRLTGVLQRERAFSADASHQLRTPLTALRVHLEGALASPAADYRDEIASALQEIDRLEESVATLLNLARDVPTDRRPLDVAALLKESEVRWRRGVHGSGRTLRVEAPDDLPRIAVSEPALRQIIEVLVDNAIAYGGGAVSVSARRLQGGVAIDVSDEGAGIAVDARNIFDRRRSGSGGTGIGLALARSLAEAEDGRLTLLRPGPHPVFRLVFATASP
jgi:signal transduction histidine kinase